VEPGHRSGGDEKALDIIEVSTFINKLDAKVKSDAFLCLCCYCIAVN